MLATKRWSARFVAILTVLTVLVVSPGVALGQGRLLDRATMVISRDGEVVGREEFTLHRGRVLDGGAGTFHTGYTLSTSGYYPTSRSYAGTMSVVAFNADSQPSSARMDLEGTGQPNVFVDFTARRITVRNRTSTGESAGQFPKPARMLVVDESLLCSFAVVLPGNGDGSVVLFYPRSGRSARARLEDHGTQPTEVAGGERRLRHWTLGTGDVIRHLWYDSSGRLVKIDIPSERLTAYRSPGN